MCGAFNVFHSFYMSAQSYLCLLVIVTECAQDAKMWVPLDERLCICKACHMAAAAHQQEALALHELKHLLLCLAALSGLHRATSSDLFLQLKHEETLSCLPRAINL